MRELEIPYIKFPYYEGMNRDGVGSNIGWVYIGENNRYD